jgi:GDPmannose 4,6-dehydratase
VLRKIPENLREFLDTAFTCVGLAWEKYVAVDPTLYRPTEVDCLLGDATKAHRELGWKPNISFRELVHIMVQEDLRREGITAVFPGLDEPDHAPSVPCVLANAAA